MIDDVILGSDEIIFNPSQYEFTNQILNDDLSLKHSTTKQFAFYGGFRCGKSFDVQLITFLLSLKYPGLRVCYIRATYDKLKDTVIKQFRDDFSKYGQFKYQDNSKDGSRVAKFSNGSSIRFRAFDTDTSILSAEYDLICFCQLEEIPKALYLQALGRLSGKRMPRAILLAEGNPTGNWVKEVFYNPSPEQRKEKGIYFLNASTEANLENLPDDYIETLKQNYTDEDFERWVKSSWQNLSGQVFSGFDESRNVIEPISREQIGQGEIIAIGGDYGYRTPSAFEWCFKNYDGDIIAFDEFYKSEQSAAQLAEANKKLGSFITAMDYSIKRPDRDGGNLWDDLLKLGVRLTESNKDELRNIALVNSLFAQGRLKICSNCRNLIAEIKEYQYPDVKIGSNKEASETPIQKKNHAIDAFLYVVNYLYYKTSVSPETIAAKRTLQAITVRRTRRSAADYG